jgi:FKBP-type peptidyl-prolyl cis-trans isomerase FklB
MKKMTFVAAMAIAAATLTSCGGDAPKASLKSDIDTLSYAIGVSLGNEFTQYEVMTRQLGVDSAYIADFIKGVNDGADAKDDKRKAAYYAGIQIGQQISKQIIPGVTNQMFGDDSTKVLSQSNLMSAFINIISGKKALMEKNVADSIQNEYQQKQYKIQQAKRRAELEARYAEEYAENKKAGEEFLKQNKEKEGVVTLPSGVQYKILKKGEGPVAKPNQTVEINYAGRLIDGTEFDSSAKHGDKPVPMRADQGIDGWNEVIQLMPAGSEWEVYIPQELAYGPEDRGTIKPFSALIFKVEVVNVK